MENKRSAEKIKRNVRVWIGELVEVLGSVEWVEELEETVDPV